MTLVDHLVLLAQSAVVSVCEAWMIMATVDIVRRARELD